MEKKTTKMQVIVGENEYTMTYHPNMDDAGLFSIALIEGETVTRSGSDTNIVGTLFRGLASDDLNKVTLAMVLNWNQMLTVDMQEHREG